MDRTLYTLIGGNFLELDDLEFEQLAIRKAFEGRLSFYQDVTLAADGFIISGCDAVLNVGNFDISPGFIAFKGEVYEVVAHSIPDNVANTFFWDVVVTFDPNGTEAFEDASTQETYEVRRVELKSLAIPPADIMFFDRLNPAAPSTTQNDLVITKQFSKGINTGGTPLSEVTIPLGAWNMVTTPSISIFHPILNVLKIRGVQVWIIRDDQGANFALEQPDVAGVVSGGVLFAVGPLLAIIRTTGGSFDNASFDAGALNRGFATIKFEP